MQVKIDTMSKISFGPRLKALRLQSQYPSATAFAEASGISRAALYLWEASDDPPPSKHWDQLCAVLGISRQHLLMGQGMPSFADAPTSSVQENSTPYSAPASETNKLLAEARRLLEEILGHAKNDPVRLGWIITQLRQHLRTPMDWLAYQGDPSDHPAVKEAIARAHQNAFRNQADEGKKDTGSAQPRAAS